MKQKRKKIKRNLLIIYCNVLVIIMFLGFFIADRNIRKTSFGEDSEFLEINKTRPYIYELRINGGQEKFMVNLSFLSIVDKIKQGL